MHKGLAKRNGLTIALMAATATQLPSSQASDTAQVTAHIHTQVNNPYSAAFLATSKHTPKRPNTPTVILPSAPHFQKFSKERSSHTNPISPKLYSSSSGLDRSKRNSSSGMLAHRCVSAVMVSLM